MAGEYESIMASCRHNSVLLEAWKLGSHLMTWLAVESLRSIPRHSLVVSFRVSYETRSYGYKNPITKAGVLSKLAHEALLG